MRTPLGEGRGSVKYCLGSSTEHLDKLFLCYLPLFSPFTTHVVQLRYNHMSREAVTTHADGSQCNDSLTSAEAVQDTRI